MRHSNVNPRSAQRGPLAQVGRSVSPATTSATVALPTAAALAAADARCAANDDTAATQNTTHNPLWVIVIGMGCLFGVMAAVMALN